MLKNRNKASKDNMVVDCENFAADMLDWQKRMEQLNDELETKNKLEKKNESKKR